MQKDLVNLKIQQKSLDPLDNCCPVYLTKLHKQHRLKIHKAFKLEPLSGTKRQDSSLQFLCSDKVVHLMEN